jgi:histone deacetylase 6
MNIPLNTRGLGDDDYMSAMHHLVLPVAHEFNPQLVLMSAG